MITKVTFRWDGREVSGAWHRSTSSGKALLLAHGAGYNMNTRLLIDIADALAERGVNVLRFNFPYTEAGRRAPDPQPRLEQCYTAVAWAAAEEFPRPVLGGKSMGGRIASHIVANGFSAGGLVFLGYPLHPVGKPERIRNAHLKDIDVPMLFLQGTRDPFATPELLHETVESLRKATLVEIEGGDHSFKLAGRTTQDVNAELIEAIARFLVEIPSPAA
jgi:predicted alpha/beta-hydrolase family hydrolase